MSRKSKKRVPQRLQQAKRKLALAHRMQQAIVRKQLAQYRVGDPIRAKLFINTGEIGNPEIIAHPGDPGVIVGIKEPGSDDFGLLAVRFGDEVVDLMPKEIEPDWEEEDEREA